MPFGAHANVLYKPFGALGVGVLIVGLAFLVWRWPQDAGKTFSQHAAAQRASILYYVALFAVVLPLLLLFFVAWFVPTRHVGRWFDILIAASAALQFSVTLIPEIDGWKSAWHRALTFCSAILLIPCLILTTAATHGFEKILSAASAAIMLGIIGFAVNRQHNYAYTLLLQIFYYAAFFVAILWVAYA